MRVVIDTGAVISALLQRDGTSRKAFARAFNHCQPLTSFATLAELKDVLGKPKFRNAFTRAEARALISLINQRSELIEVHSTVTVCRDSTDNKFLSLALDGKADVILSRDPDLLILHPFENIPILNPADFMIWISLQTNK